ncbi:hypothetical protein CR513_34260, partial [Mucuna pruriens]
MELYEYGKGSHGRDKGIQGSWNQVLAGKDMAGIMTLASLEDSFILKQPNPNISDVVQQLGQYWLYYMFSNLRIQFSQPASIYCDNNSVICLSHSSNLSQENEAY